MAYITARATQMYYRQGGDMFVAYITVRATEMHYGYSEDGVLAFYGFRHLLKKFGLAIVAFVCAISVQFCLGAL